jgi:hypothetical protein
MVCAELKEVSLQQRNSIPIGQMDKSAIRDFLQELKRSSEPMRAMKLVILSHGRIGKTTLLHHMKEILHPTTPDNQVCVLTSPHPRNIKRGSYIYFHIFYIFRKRMILQVQSVLTVNNSHLMVEM